MQNAREQLLADGYCVVDGGLPGGKLDELRRWSDDLIGSTKHSAKWKYQGSDIKLSSIKSPPTRGPDFPPDAIVDFLIEHPAKIMQALGIADLTSGGTYQIISKPPGAPALYWHQDWARWDDPISMSPWPQQVFLNWYLTDTSVENGCLRLLAGSHRERLEIHEHLIPPHEGGGYEVEETNEWMFYDHPDAIDVPIKAGDLMIGDARLLHGTRPNLSNERRTVLLGWFYRRANTVPENWTGDVPVEILDRPAKVPFNFNRQPGAYLPWS